MKKNIKVLVIGLLLAAIYAIYNQQVKYNKLFSITDSKTEITNSIVKGINNTGDVTDKITTVQEIYVENHKYIFFVFKAKNNEQYYGLAGFEKGNNEKWRSGELSYGNASFHDNILLINNHKYIILSGINPDNKVSYITVDFEGKEYKFDLQKDDYFIVYHQVPNDKETLYLDMDNIKLYSSDDRDITEEIALP